MKTTWFPRRWPAQHPERLQLYSLATPNGQKIGIALEELGLAYEAHRIHIGAGDQFDEDYVRISPNSKIPSVIDPQGPGGAPIVLMESGAILLYLAEKTGRLLPTDPVQRWQALQWIFFQVGHVGPTFGNLAHFAKVARGKTDAYGEERFGKEVRRLLGVLDSLLRDRDHLVGAYSMADIAMFPWVDALASDDARDAVGYDDFTHVQEWVERIRARPATAPGKRSAQAPEVTSDPHLAGAWLKLRERRVMVMRMGWIRNLLCAVVWVWALPVSAQDQASCGEVFPSCGGQAYLAMQGTGPPIDEAVCLPRMSSIAKPVDFKVVSEIVETPVIPRPPIQDDAALVAAITGQSAPHQEEPVDRIPARVRGSLEACYAEGHRVAPRPEGSITVMLTTRRGQCVTAVKLISSEVPDPLAEACLLEAFRGYIRDPVDPPGSFEVAVTFRTEPI